MVRIIINIEPSLLKSRNGGSTYEYIIGLLVQCMFDQQLSFYHILIYLSFFPSSICESWWPFPFLCSPEIPKINFHVELDAAKATWLSNDIVMFSTKTGEMLLLTVVYDGRYANSMDHYLSYCCAAVLAFVGVIELIIICFFFFRRTVRRLDLMKSKASVISSVGCSYTSCAYIPFHI